MLFMEATQLRVQLRKLDCGSQKAQLTGRAVFTNGSMSKLLSVGKLFATSHSNYLASHVCSWRLWLLCFVYLLKLLCVSAFLSSYAATWGIFIGNSWIELMLSYIYMKWILKEQMLGVHVYFICVLFVCPCLAAYNHPLPVLLRPCLPFYVQVWHDFKDWNKRILSNDQLFYAIL